MIVTVTVEFAKQQLFGDATYDALPTYDSGLQVKLCVTKVVKLHCPASGVELSAISVTPNPDILHTAVIVQLTQLENPELPHLAQSGDAVYVPVHLFEPTNVMTTPDGLSRHVVLQVFVTLACIVSGRSQLTEPQ